MKIDEVKNFVQNLIYWVSRYDFGMHLVVTDYSECSLCVSVSDDVTENDFMSQLDSWLSHNPNEACSKGGHAAYGSAVYQVFNDTRKQEWLEKIAQKDFSLVFPTTTISKTCTKIAPQAVVHNL